LQEKGTEKILYGLDDINDVSETIIVIPLSPLWAAFLQQFRSLILLLLILLFLMLQVEGEMDKLSLEEAGFRNCVSVPGGAPGKVSTKELPSFEKVCTDTKILWIEPAETFLCKQLSCVFLFLCNLFYYIYIYIFMCVIGM
jgi:twinkle protein